MRKLESVYWTFWQIKLIISLCIWICIILPKCGIFVRFILGLQKTHWWRNLQNTLKLTYWVWYSWQYRVSIHTSHSYAHYFPIRVSYSVCYVGISVCNNHLKPCFLLLLFSVCVCVCVAVWTGSSSWDENTSKLEEKEWCRHMKSWTHDAEAMKTTHTG